MWVKYKMRLTKWFLRGRFNRTKKQIENQRELMNERGRCTVMLNEITTAQFALYHVSSGNAYTVKVPERSIDGYIERLRKARTTVHLDRILNANDFNWDAVTVTVDEFFISSDGYYQDVEKAVERLKKAALDLCAESEKTDDAEYGIHEHNRRLLTKLFINLQELSEALIDVSLTN